MPIFAEAAAKQANDADFVKELKGWIRFSASDAMRTRDGLYSACSGNPVVPTWIGNFMFSQFYTASGEADKLVRQMRSSSGIAVFTSEKNEPEGWVRVGRSYQRFALQATALGIRHAFVNQPVEVAETRPAFAKATGFGGRRPDLVVRFGHAPAMPRSLRRPVADVLKSA